MQDQYIHTNIDIRQSSKKVGAPCGDVVEVYRDAITTNIILCDGIGSGLKANLYAHMCCARIVEMLKSGSSLQRCFDAVGDTMNKAWGKDEPFAVFTIARILENGKTTVLSYDMPTPVFIGKHYATLMKTRTFYWEKALISESNFQLNRNEGIILMSDGITQAGLGNGLTNGWESEGVSRFVNNNEYLLKQDMPKLAEAVHNQALLLWGRKYGDDCSVVIAFNRRGITLNILTGTPISKEDDSEFVEEFMESEGIKVVCGGSSAKMLAREIRQPIDIVDEGTFITPPAFSIPGITLSTEGMITLNQLYNILGEDIDYTDDENVVLELARYFQNADKILFWVGKAANIGNQIMELKQQGILNRLKIVELISEKLRTMNKLVSVKTK